VRKRERERERDNKSAGGLKGSDWEAEIVEWYVRESSS
jgi:hypothetical protein